MNATSEERQNREGNPPFFNTGPRGSRSWDANAHFLLYPSSLRPSLVLATDRKSTPGELQRDPPSPGPFLKTLDHRKEGTDNNERITVQ